MSDGLVERLRNGGQPHLADMAEGLLKALRLFVIDQFHHDYRAVTEYERQDEARRAIAAAEGKS